MGGLLLLALGAAGGWTGARRANAGPIAAAVPTLLTATVEMRPLAATVLATGVLRPQVGAQVAVGSRISGVLRRLRVTVGDRVAAGDLLAELDPQEAATAIARGEAALAVATAERAFAQREFERTRALSEREFVPASELSAAQRLLEANGAREREAVAALDAARVQLGYTRILAPIAGVVGTVSTQEGETVAASLAAPTFLTIVDLTRLEVWAYVDETDVGLVRPGQRAAFTVSTYPDATFEGRVVAVRPTAEVIDNVVTYVARIAIDDRQGLLLRPEMTATIRIEREGRERALAIPNGALRRDADGTYVLMNTPAGAERRAVRVGFRGSEHSEIVSGLTAGDRVNLGYASSTTPRENGNRP
jgi:RND family efflux transporter MFP subunit